MNTTPRQIVKELAISIGTLNIARLGAPTAGRPGRLMDDPRCPELVRAFCSPPC